MNKITPEEDLNYQCFSPQDYSNHPAEFVPPARAAHKLQSSSPPACRVAISKVKKGNFIMKLSHDEKKWGYLNHDEQSYRPSSAILRRWDQSETGDAAAQLSSERRTSVQPQSKTTHTANHNWFGLVDYQFWPIQGFMTPHILSRGDRYWYIILVLRYRIASNSSNRQFRLLLLLLAWKNLGKHTIMGQQMLQHSITVWGKVQI